MSKICLAVMFCVLSVASVSLGQESGVGYGSPQLGDPWNAIPHAPGLRFAASGDVTVLTGDGGGGYGDGGYGVSGGYTCSACGCGYGPCVHWTQVSWYGHWPKDGYGAGHCKKHGCGCKSCNSCDTCSN